MGVTKDQQISKTFKLQGKMSLNFYKQSNFIRVEATTSFEDVYEGKIVESEFIKLNKLEKIIKDYQFKVITATKIKITIQIGGFFTLELFKKKKNNQPILVNNTLILPNQIDKQRLNHGIYMKIIILTVILISALYLIIESQIKNLSQHYEKNMQNKLYRKISSIDSQIKQKIRQIQKKDQISSIENRLRWKMQQKYEILQKQISSIDSNLKQKIRQKYQTLQKQISSIDRATKQKMRQKDRKDQILQKQISSIDSQLRSKIQSQKQTLQKQISSVESATKQKMIQKDKKDQTIQTNLYNMITALSNRLNNSNLMWGIMSMQETSNFDVNATYKMDFTNGISLVSVKVLSDQLVFIHNNQKCYVDSRSKRKNTCDLTNQQLWKLRIE